ncbi:CDP-diacylglycerol--glycerol-3-phosphate 3-phosphatidyltransferase [Frigoribacterium sp. CFBP9039]|uniref:CDP-diacylglycerol--glycerol-3-phosphate 3-phosphatidyltransferase n=1 Tax=Frigoribacterium sp. CFBP9029 TaxID=3096541 RepID=UPI002A6A28B2|nr:CDP-diacylglycerol--glycerol-3-phosphate 3-phosphatidyltransferase [Frigoribacterium sp. CFBP9039]MDY0946515.1 CDP-diacylglycerol--glycerol-3-phosphate 3-phosphatidyltransferase [Frigoribacterium sp. CFBP9039]
MTDSDRSDGAPRGATFPFRGRVARRGPGPASTANIANIITVVRILMAPLFMAWLLIDDGADGSLRIAAAALFVVAILTDSLDGMLARGLDLVTDFGKIVDPIADKVLIGGALVSLSILGELPWWVTALILVREIGITVFRFAVIRDRVIPASRGGKLKTVLQAVAVTLALFPLWNLLGPGMHWVNGVLMTAAVVATLVSGLDYLRVAAKHGRPS